MSRSARELHQSTEDGEDDDRSTNGAGDAISPADLSEEFYRVALLLRHSARQCVKPEGDAALRLLSVPRMRLLHALSESGAQRLRMHELSTALGVTPRNVTTIMDGLEHEGFLTRRRDPADRRAIFIELTDFGRAHIAGMHELGIRMGERIFAPLDTRERQEFLRLLLKIRRAAGFPGQL